MTKKKGPDARQLRRVDFMQQRVSRLAQLSLQFAGVALKLTTATAGHCSG